MKIRKEGSTHKIVIEDLVAYVGIDVVYYQLEKGLHRDMTEKKQRRLKSWSDGCLVFKDFPVKHKGRKLLIPFELTIKQSFRLTEFYELDGLEDEEEWIINFDRVINDIAQRIIKRKVKLAKIYFEKHPDEWVRMVKSIKITDKQIDDRIARYKDGKLRKFQVFHLR
ncbi:MAG: hypothetical protein JXA01_01965 [Dehalococcoidia bacterium]|nr:hypothetical protein [Dehalococcoidia bacterium]